MIKGLLFLFLCCIVSVSRAGEGQPAVGRPRVFMENRGQVQTPDGQPAPQILYHMSGRGINVSLTASGMNYTFIRPVAGKKTAEKQLITADPAPVEYETIGMGVSLEAANPAARVTAERQQEYYEHYYTTLARRQGGMGRVRSFERIVYHDVYPKIDWVVYIPEEGGGVKYDFVVRPGGDPARIRMKYDGAALSLKEDGSMTAATELGSIQEARPYSYMKEGGEEEASAYRLDGSTISFAVAKPAAGTLVIDPQVVWVTYFGGGRYDYGSDVACYKGDSYISGSTESTLNIATLGSRKTHLSGTSDAFLAKFGSTGRIQWSTYFGGLSFDAAYTVALDTSSTATNVIIGGRTDSPDSIATSGSHQQVSNGINSGFVAKFTAAGILLWSTYYGGNGRTLVYAAACDAQGNIIAGGATESNSGIASSGFPGRHSSNFSGYTPDGFVVKFSSVGVRQWGRNFGGGGQDWVTGIHAFRSGSIAITGTTTSLTDIATHNGYQTSRGDSLDAFIAKLSPSGIVDWSTYIGGEGLEFSGGVTGDDTGSIFVSGGTSSQGNISSSGSHQPVYAGSGDCFVSMFNAIGGLIWSSYYGGNGNESALTGGHYLGGTRGYTDVSFSRGRLWLCGTSYSVAGISSPLGYQDSLSFSPPQTWIGDAFVATFDIAGNRLWGSYFGGRGGEVGVAITTDKLSNVYMLGTVVNSPDLAANTPYQDTLQGGPEAFLVRIFDSVSILRVRGIRPYCINDTFSLNHYITANGTMHPQNVYRAELSNVSGSFTSPTVIGTLAAPVGTIPCKLPAGVTGAGYRVRIVASKPLRISDTAAIQVSSAIPVPVITRNGGVLSTGTFATYQWYKSGVAIAGATGSSFKPTSNGNYTVMVTTTGGCKGTSAVYNMTSVGIATSGAIEEVKIYPNPAQDMISIEGAGPGIQLSLINVTGQQVAVHVLHAQKEHISIGQLPDGVYMLRLVDKDGPVKLHSIVKQ